MQAKIYRFKKQNPFIYEIREIISDSEFDTLEHYVPPMGHPEIIIYKSQNLQILNTSFKDGFIKGQFNTFQKINFSPNYHFISIVLHPYGLKQIFNINANELVNSLIDINEYPITFTLKNHIKKELTFNEECLKKITNTLLKCKSYPITNNTILFINLLNKSEINKINKLIENKGINIRTLQRNFKREVGLTPKEYLSIVRMMKINQQIQNKVDLLQVISNNNLTDHSHIYKEFKKISKINISRMINEKLFLSDQLPLPEIIEI